MTATAGLLTEKGFLLTVVSTVIRGAIGFAASFTLGVVLGAICGLSPAFDSFLRPALIILRSTPVAAFILLALIWFDSDIIPVAVSFMTMFPIICTNTAEGIRSTDQKLVEMASFYKVGKMRQLLKIYLPFCAPFIRSGAASASGIGWKAIITGEVLSQPVYGIGTAMHGAQVFLRVDILIGWTLIAVLLSFLSDKLIKWTGDRIGASIRTKGI